MDYPISYENQSEKKKTVFVTGSSRGIGKNIAKKFLKNGFNVCINGNKNIDNLTDTLDEFYTISENVLAVHGDVSNYNKCILIFDQIQQRFGNVDILINNAGISQIQLFNLMTPDQWNYVLNTNLNSVLNCSHVAIQSMIRNHNGVIINISSVWGETGASCETIYSTTKGAVNSFTKSLAKELAPSNVRVNAIACGMIETKMNQTFSQQEKDNIKEQIPIGRFGNTNDIANLAYFLASDNAEYITGQIIKCDGGWI